MPKLGMESGKTPSAHDKLVKLPSMVIPGVQLY